MNSEATELKGKILRHLSRRPNEFRYSDHDQYREKYWNWKDKLDDLKISISEGQSTGDILTDYALMRAYSKADAIEAETYLHYLQDKIKLAVNQEILVQSMGTGASGGFHPQIYHYQIYELACIQDGSITKRIDKTMPAIPVMFLKINTEGFVRCDTDFGLLKNRQAEFLPQNLSVPKKEDFVAVGTEEIMTWRNKFPSNEIKYQMLSQTLKTSLAQKISNQLTL